MSWYQLLGIINYAKREREFWSSQPPMACPRDGEPMRGAPAGSQQSLPDLHCRFDGFTWPRDG